MGTDADRVNRNQPTMQLNLRGYPAALQESLVIHEFGHALGLEHEHQRSDFWEVLGKFLDTENMMKDLKYPKTEEGKASFVQDWKQINAGNSEGTDAGNGEGTDAGNGEETDTGNSNNNKPKYDYLSIMHYR